MLSLFRQRGLSNIVYGIIIAATIFAFVIGFRPQATSKTASLTETCVARVRGRCIDPKDFGAAYRILMPSRSNALSRKLNLKRAALDGLIERELLVDEARRLGITVSDSEVTDELYRGYVRVSVPAADPATAQRIVQETYQSYARAGIISAEVAQAHVNDRDTAIPIDFRDPKTKIFDMKVYERQVRMLSNRSTTEFREEQAREMLAAKMRDVVRDPVRVSEAEAWDEYQRRYATATVGWLLVKEAWAARWIVDAPQANVDAWVKEHAADVDKAVEERKKEDAPKAGHLRHILVKLPFPATDDEKALGLAKLSWAAAQIRAGASFAEVARATSDDTGSAAQGGDVGDKTDGFVRPFKVAADALKPGETTAGAVETQFGYHLIMRDDPAKAADIEAQVKRDVGRDLYRRAKGTEAAQVVARKVGDAMKGGANAEDALATVLAGYAHANKITSLKVLPPPPAAAGDAGADDDTLAKADGGAAATRRPAPLPEGRLDASTDTDRPQWQTSTAFNSGGDPFPGLSPAGTSSVVGFAFSAKPGAVDAEPVRTAEGFVLVTLKDRKTVTRDEFAKDRAAVEEDLLRAKRDEAMALYVKQLRERAKGDIKIDPSYIEEVGADGGAGGANDEEDEY
ncbi:MAG TPA: peptidylprolyl isomerase [Polyangiaceae bacterium]|jgi:peptidyl-prolyl cis-trans isomerase D